jgi:hypothetical protein
VIIVHVVVSFGLSLLVVPCNGGSLALLPPPPPVGKQDSLPFKNREKY